MDMNCILPAQLFEMPLSLRIAEKIIPQLQRSLVFAALVILSLPVNAMINPELLRTKALEDTTHTLEIIVTESDIKDTGEILVIELKAKVLEVVKVHQGPEVSAGDTIIIKYRNHYAYISKLVDEQTRKFNEEGYVGRQVDLDARSLSRGDIVRAYLIWGNKGVAGNIFYPAGREWSFERIKDTESVNGIGAECAMKPAHLQIPILEPGPPSVSGESSGSCRLQMPEDQRLTSHSENLSLTVNAKGPSGAGRYWEVQVGLVDKSGRKSDPAFCLETTTLGWRTLQKYKRLPLPWKVDLDDDDADELIIWDSFRLSDEPNSGNYALVAWVYRLDVHGTLNIDWDLSRMMAAELAEAYRVPLRASSKLFKVLRVKASLYLEAFANEQCRLI